MFHKEGMAKDSQLKAMKKLHDSYNHLRKQAKETKKMIEPFVENETDKNRNMIKRHEDALKTYNQELKKRDFYFYKTGPEEALKKMQEVRDEIKDFEEKNENLGFCAQKFGDEGTITNSIRAVENIKVELGFMEQLWGHIDLCLKTFDGYMASKWLETKPYDMDEEVKKLFKSAKEIKVDKRCNAYMGIIDAIKKWAIFLPLIAELREDAMRDRHWESLKEAIGQKFKVDDKLTLEDVFNLNLGNHKEEVEEICDQAK